MTGSLRRFAVPLLALFLAGPAAAETAPPPVAPAAAATPVIGAAARNFRLPNGLEVVVIPDHRAPVVTHMVWYRAGSADEPAGRSGIAHYLEHLMFKGTPDHPGGEFSKIVAEIGGQENAFTSWDYTAYYQRVARDKLKLVMSLEADRMQNLALDAATAAPELKVVLEERSMRTDNDPSAKLGEAIDAALHPNHPYRIPVIGWRSEIERLTVEDAKAFYDRFYTPNNAILVVAGDVEVDEVRDLALTTYGRVPRRAEPPVERVRPKDPESVVTRSVVLADERVSQPSWRRVYQVPSSHTAAPGESEALEVFTDLFGGGATSRLYRSLVIDKGVAAQVGAYYQSDALDDGRFVLYAVPRDGVSLADLAKAVDGELASALAAAPSAADVARTKAKVLAEAIKVQDNQATLARLFGEELAVGGDLDRVRTWPARIVAVEPETIRTTAAKYLVPERAVTGELRSAPPSGKPRSGPTLPFGMTPGGAIRLVEPPPAIGDATLALP